MRNDIYFHVFKNSEILFNLFVLFFFTSIWKIIWNFLFLTYFYSLVLRYVSHGAGKDSGMYRYAWKARGCFIEDGLSEHNTWRGFALRSRWVVFPPYRIVSLTLGEYFYGVRRRLISCPEFRTTVNLHPWVNSDKDMLTGTGAMSDQSNINGELMFLIVHAAQRIYFFALSNKRRKELGKKMYLYTYTFNLGT